MTVTKGIIESISKTSIVVSILGGTATLTGKLVEEKAPSFKLGDYVDFEHQSDKSTDVTVLVKSKPAQTAAPAPAAGTRTNSSSPISKPSYRLDDKAWQEERENGATSW